MLSFALLVVGSHENPSVPSSPLLPVREITHYTASSFINENSPTTIRVPPGVPTAARRGINCIYTITYRTCSPRITIRLYSPLYYVIRRDKIFERQYGTIRRATDKLQFSLPPCGSRENAARGRLRRAPPIVVSP